MRPSTAAWCSIEQDRPAEFLAGNGCEHAQAPWYPSRLTFGEFKGRHFREALSHPALRAWLEWLAGSSSARSAGMGRWYLTQLTEPEPEVDDALAQVEPPAGRGAQGGEPTAADAAQAGVARRAASNASVTVPRPGRNPGS